MTSIAVVGIDCRFPGAPDKDAFWRLLMDGVVTDTEVPSQRWDVDTFYHPDGVAGSMNTRRAHFIDDVDAFDNDFFGIAPIEAAALDPQQRLLLQSSWRALEDGGIDPRSLAGTPTGVFVGVMSSEWTSLQMLDYADVTAFVGRQRLLHDGKSRLLPPRPHWTECGDRFGLLVVTDRHTSGVRRAAFRGHRHRHRRRCESHSDSGAFDLLHAGRAFRARRSLQTVRRDADGIGRGEGIAAVVLRRLDDAIADRQPIYAVVRSSVTNHDGRSNGVTAPNRRSQVELMRRALSLAEVDAGQIAFVEAHGTGTLLGDMIEANALGDMHKTRSGEPCLLGSVKGNIGHTEGSAGIAAFIKTCLALHHRVLPPTVFGDSANPGLRLDEHGLQLTESAAGVAGTEALGGVSSFGLGGSNAHAILESAPAVASPDPGATGVLTISAPSEQALRRNAASIASALQTVDDRQVAAWCRATNVVKRSHRHRVVLEGNRDTLVDGLREFLAGARPDLTSSAPRRNGPGRESGCCAQGRGRSTRA